MLKVQSWKISNQFTDQFKVSQMSIHYCTYGLQELILLFHFNIHERVYLHSLKPNSHIHNIKKVVEMSAKMIHNCRRHTRLKRLFSNADFEFCRSCHWSEYDIIYYVFDSQIVRKEYATNEKKKKTQWTIRPCKQIWEVIHESRTTTITTKRCSTRWGRLHGLDDAINPYHVLSSKIDHLPLKSLLIVCPTVFLVLPLTLQDSKIESKALPNEPWHWQQTLECIEALKHKVALTRTTRHTYWSRHTIP